MVGLNAMAETKRLKMRRTASYSVFSSSSAIAAAYSGPNIMCQSWPEHWQ